MRVPSRSTRNDRDYLEPARSPLIPLTCLLVIAVAVAVVGAELGGRFALITIGFAAVALLTRVPRVLPAAAALTLLVAVFAVLAGGESVPALATTAQHAIVAHVHGSHK